MRTCKICGTELAEWEGDICQNCQDNIINMEFGV